MVLYVAHVVFIEQNRNKTVCRVPKKFELWDWNKRTMDSALTFHAIDLGLIPAIPCGPLSLARSDPCV